MTTVYFCLMATLADLCFPNCPPPKKKTRGGDNNNVINNADNEVLFADYFPFWGQLGVEPADLLLKPYIIARGNMRGLYNISRGRFNIISKNIHIITLDEDEQIIYFDQLYWHNGKYIIPCRRGTVI